MLKEILEDRGKEDYILYNTDTKELWITYAQGSGSTTQLRNIESYITDGKENFDSNVRLIKRWAKFNKPLKKKNNVALYEIPTYPMAKDSFGRDNYYDIFGGNTKPNGKMYMIITEENSTVINFFSKKNEALAWIRAID